MDIPYQQRTLSYMKSKMTREVHSEREKTTRGTYDYSCYIQMKRHNIVLNVTRSSTVITKLAEITICQSSHRHVVKTELKTWIKN